MRYPQFIFSATVSSAESTALPIRCMALPTAVFLVFGRGAIVIDDALQYAEDVPAAMDDAIREMKHWVTVV